MYTCITPPIASIIPLLVYPRVSIDWFLGKKTGQSHDLHGKIGKSMVSGEDFPMKSQL